MSSRAKNHRTLTPFGFSSYSNLHKFSIEFTNQFYLSTVYLQSLGIVEPSEHRSKNVEVNPMKKVLTAIAISMSALLATSAMAAPNDYRDNNHQNSTHPNAKWNNQSNDHRYNGNDGRFDRNDRDHKGYNNSSVNPSRQWRTGQTLPRQYNSSRYEVNGSTLKRLPKAGRNQQWYKISGDYVLINERNDKILKIVS